MRIVEREGGVLWTAVITTRIFDICLGRLAFGRVKEPWQKLAET